MPIKKLYEDLKQFADTTFKEMSVDFDVEDNSIVVNTPYECCTIVYIGGSREPYLVETHDIDYERTFSYQESRAKIISHFRSDCEYHYKVEKCNISVVNPINKGKRV